MDLRNQQIKDSYGNLVTIGTTLGAPTTGFLQNGQGSNVTALTMTSTTLEGGLVVNELGANADFRVEGQSAPNLLFVDASTARVGIGTNAPASIFNVRKDASTVWSTLFTNVSTEAFTPFGHEVTIQNDENDTTGSFASIFFKPGQTSANTGINSARIAAIRIAPAETEMAFSIRGGVTTTGMVERMRIKTAEIVMNDTGVDQDFRVEGDTDANLLFVDASTDRVGIGTNAPATRLEISGDRTSIIRLTNTRVAESNDQILGQVQFYGNDTTPGAGIRSAIKAFTAVNGGGSYLTISTADGTTNDIERLRIDSSGNLGIGTNTPAAKLDVLNSGVARLMIGYAGVSGNYYDADTHIFRLANGTDRLTLDSSGYLRMASGTGGIQFGGDTAAANALDDYEEGTWTMGIAFGGASAGITYSRTAGQYTKIGRQVSFSGWVSLSSKGSSTGDMTITGLPVAYVSGNADSYYSPVPFRITSITFANQVQAYVVKNGTSIAFEEVTEAGVATALTDADFANNSAIMVSGTYFV